ncbi:MAG: hypothetical protein JJV90_00460, partial [Spiroplasma sp.]|nr:hypothetical protein [Mycoplasmatales bacterium]
LFNRVICDYFRFIFKELENKKVDCNRYYVLIHEYEQNDFIEFLNENLDVELSAFEIPGFRNITSANLKPALAVVRFQEKMDRLDDRGNNG